MFERAHTKDIFYKHSDSLKNLSRGCFVGIALSMCQSACGRYGKNGTTSPNVHYFIRQPQSTFGESTKSSECEHVCVAACRSWWEKTAIYILSLNTPITEKYIINSLND